MLTSVLVALLLSTQPVADEAPLPEDQAAETVEAVEAEAAEPVEIADAEEAAEEAAPEDPGEELICRRRIEQGTGVGQRHVTKKVCKTRDEWNSRKKSR